MDKHKTNVKITFIIYIRFSFFTLQIPAWKTHVRTIENDKYVTVSSLKMSLNSSIEKVVVSGRGGLYCT